MDKMVALFTPSTGSYGQNVRSLQVMGKKVGKSCDMGPNQSQALKSLMVDAN